MSPTTADDPLFITEEEVSDLTGRKIQKEPKQ